MKTERVNTVIFIVSLVVFLLQITGYLAPAWFVKEVAVRPDPKGMRADGRRFHLPQFHDNADETMTSLDQNQNVNDKNQGDVRKCSENSPSARPEQVTSPVDRPKPTKPPDDRPELTTVRLLEPSKPITDNRKPTKSSDDFTSRSSKPLTDLMRPTKPASGSTKPTRPASGGTKPTGSLSGGMQPTRPPSGGTKPTGSLSGGMQPTRPPSGGTKPTGSLSGTMQPIRPPSGGIKPPPGNRPSRQMGRRRREGPEFTKFSDTPEIAVACKEENCNDGTGRSTRKPTNSENETGSDETPPKNKRVSAKQHLYITAGFWYSRACVIMRGPDSHSDVGMQWCTVYARLDNKTLEEKKSMFELRLEATLGVVLCALSLLISSTACCSHKHHGRRAISSLATLFISGAVMAVPVVHIIIQHVEIHEQVIRARKWKNLTKELYEEHDLFDHYSVILCGAASVISVLFAVILTLVSCRSSSKSDTWYNLNQPLEKKESKPELPINWMHNSKITVPHVMEIKDETKDDSESGYSEVKDEYTTFTNDGASVTTDDRIEFNHNEITTFDM